MDIGKTPKISNGRTQIADEKIEWAKDLVCKSVDTRLRRKGKGTFTSPHEILGMLVEKMRELEDAVRSQSRVCISGELIDLAVSCIFGLACINSGVMDW